MKFTCPHCGKTHEVNVGKIIGAISTKAKAQAARLNGMAGGRPKVENPVRLRPHHPSHPRHLEWLAEQEKKRIRL